jgi:hypothetical protein
MANIKNLQMGATICTDKRITVKKTILGLSMKLTYKPTGSPVKVKAIELKAGEGDDLRRMLANPREKIAKALEGFKLHPTENGNYKLEFCVSEDHAFVALNLLHYSQLEYQPVGDVLFFEGEEAKLISKMF